MAKFPGVSMSVTRRLSRYYRCLGELKKKGIERISSREFAEIIGFSASQIRQDLNCFGGFGQQGYGYNVSALQYEIGRILGVEKKLPAILIGVGNMGLALINHVGFEQLGFKLTGVFDSSPNLIGRTVKQFTVRDTAELRPFCKQNNPAIAILCVPESAVHELVDNLSDWGIKGFWNFTPYNIGVAFKDKNIMVENVHISDSLMTLAYLVNESL